MLGGRSRLDLMLLFLVMLSVELYSAFGGWT